MMEEEGERRALSPHQDYGYDEIRINILPRYKTSNASGDEWRTGYSLTFMRKGESILRELTHGIDSLRLGDECWGNVVLLKDLFIEKCNQNKLSELMIGKGDICDQVGCSQKSTVTYKLKYLYDNDGTKKDPYIDDKRPLIRKFCNRHSTRGDCGLEDADINYEIMNGNLIQPLKEDISVSKQLFL